MYIVLAGDLVNGYSAHGPFRSSDDAISWGISELADSGQWQEMEVSPPDPIEEVSGDENLPPTLSEAAIEAYLEKLAASNRNEDKLPKEIMLDLSEVR